MNNWEDIHNIIVELREDEGFTWQNVVDYLSENLAMEMTAEACRKREFRFLKKQLVSDNISNNEMQMMMDLHIDTNKTTDYMTQANAYIRRISREQTCIDIAKDFADKMSSSHPFPIVGRQFIGNIPQDGEKIGILCISDWHYGIEINNYNNVYNTDIAKQRVTELAAKVLGFINQYEMKKLVVMNLGDMIAGRIHSPIKMESRIDSVTQIMEVSEIIAEFLQDLSRFVDIDYFEVLDNHSRLEPNIKESLELESLARITGFYLKQRLKDNKHICINNNTYGLDIATFKVFNHNVAGVHGDKDKQKTVINSLTMYTREFYDLILTAHLHHMSMDEDNGTIRISNGALMGTDSYAQKLRLNSKPSQTLIISTKEDVLYAVHKIDLK